MYHVSPSCIFGATSTDSSTSGEASIHLAGPTLATAPSPYPSPSFHTSFTSFTFLLLHHHSIHPSHCSIFLTFSFIIIPYILPLSLIHYYLLVLSLLSINYYIYTLLLPAFSFIIILYILPLLLFYHYLLHFSFLSFNHHYIYIYSPLILLLLLFFLTHCTSTRYPNTCG